MIHLFKGIKRREQRSRVSSQRKARKSPPLLLESLESRQLLTTVTEYVAPPLAGAPSRPAEITSFGGKLWFTQQGNAIGAVDPTNPGALTSYNANLPVNSFPTSITVGPDNQIWFVELGTGTFGRLNPANPTSNIQNVNGSNGLLPNSRPSSLTVGSNGAGTPILWFTDSRNNTLGIINPYTSPPSVTQFTIPSSMLGIANLTSQIMAGPDGKLYFTEAKYGANGVTESAIGSFDPATGTWAETKLSGAGKQPMGLTVGWDGSGHQIIWFSQGTFDANNELQSSSIGRLNINLATPTITEYAVPKVNNVPQLPYRMVTGPDGNLWFTQTSTEAGRIGTFAVRTHNFNSYAIPTSVVADPTPVGLTTGPDGSLWFTDSGGAYGRVDLDTKLVLTTQPAASVQTGAPIVVGAQIQYTSTGALKSAYNGNVAVALGANPGGGTLGGAVTLPATNGQVVFGDLTINRPGTGYTLVLSASGVAGVTTSTFNVTAPPVNQATQLLVWSQPPSVVQTNSPFSVVIVALTSTGALATNFNGDVAIALTANPGGSSMQPQVVKASGGIAIFSGLTLDAPGVGYTLGAFSGNLTFANSNPVTAFTPTPPTPSVAAASPIIVPPANRRGRPTLTGFQFTFNRPMNAATAGNPGNYIMSVYNQVTQRVNGRTVRVLAPQAIPFSASYDAATNTVRLLFAGRPNFQRGGQIVLLPGILGAEGGPLIRSTYNIGANGSSLVRA